MKKEKIMKQYVYETETGEKVFYTKCYGTHGIMLARKAVIRETAQFIIDEFDDKYNKKTGEKVGSRDSWAITTYLITKEQYQEELAKKHARTQEKLKREREKLVDEYEAKLAELDARIEKLGSE